MWVFKSWGRPPAPPATLPLADASGLKHGDICCCPVCGSEGILDVETPDNEPFAHSFPIWFDKRTKTWQCHDCWLK